MEITESKDNDSLVVKLSGKLNAESLDQCQHYVESQLDFNYKKIILDLESVDYTSSGGIRFIISTFNEAQKHNVDFCVARPTPDVKKVFDLVSLSDIVKIYDNLDDAKRN